MNAARRLLTGLGAGTACLAAVFLTAGPASAATGTVITDDTTLTIRADATTSSDSLGSLDSGATVSFDCYKTGEAITGPYGTESIWDHLDDGGYVADAWIETGSNAPTVPLCDDSGRAMGQTTSSNNGYEGQCTWGAYEQWYEATGYYPLISGNAADWADSAAANGWTVVADAQPRSIVVFQPGVQGADPTYGHVGWVTDVQDSGDGRSVTFVEMNGTAGEGNYDTRTVEDVAGMSYILAP